MFTLFAMEGCRLESLSSVWNGTGEECKGLVGIVCVESLTMMEEEDEGLDTGGSGEVAGTFPSITNAGPDEGRGDAGSREKPPNTNTVRRWRCDCSH